MVETTREMSEPYQPYLSHSRTISFSKVFVAYGTVLHLHCVSTHSWPDKLFSITKNPPSKEGSSFIEAIAIRSGACLIRHIYYERVCSRPQAFNKKKDTKQEMFLDLSLEHGAAIVGKLLLSFCSRNTGSLQNSRYVSMSRCSGLTLPVF